MKIINPSAHIIDTDSMDELIMMELAGRKCYRSEDKITPESAPVFCKGVLTKKHWSVTEFALFTIHIKLNPAMILAFQRLELKYLTIDMADDLHTLLVTGTARGFREAFMKNQTSTTLNIIIAFLQKQVPVLFDEFTTACDNLDFTQTPLKDTKIILLSPEQVDMLPDKLKLRHRWVMVEYIVNRAVSHELVRHRPVSWLQESQRYCRYSDDKFGSEVTFIDPRGAFPAFQHNDDPHVLDVQCGASFDELTPEGSQNVINYFNYVNWRQSCEQAEQTYLVLLEPGQGISPQAARTVLPNSCKTELFQLCNLEEWVIFFGLRTTPAAEPSMREVTIPLYEEFRAKWPTIFNKEM